MFNMLAETNYIRKFSIPYCRKMQTNEIIVKINTERVIAFVSTEIRIKSKRQ